MVVQEEVILKHISTICMVVNPLTRLMPKDVYQTHVKEYKAT